MKSTYSVQMHKAPPLTRPIHTVTVNSCQKFSNSSEQVNGQTTAIGYLFLQAMALAGNLRSFPRQKTRHPLPLHCWCYCTQPRAADRKVASLVATQTGGHTDLVLESCVDLVLESNVDIVLDSYMHKYIHTYNPNSQGGRTVYDVCLGHETK